jgi:phytoene desaturase
VASIVVIGAGIAGLSVAARLAATGHAVTVCEQASEIGGKVGVFEHDGFTFDTGPSLLTLPAVFRDLFLKTGAALEKQLELVPVEPACHYRFADGLELDMPNGNAFRIAQAWDHAAGDGAGDDWARFIRRAGEIWNLTREPFLESPLNGAKTLLRLARKPADVHTVAPWASLRDLGRHYLNSPYQRTFLDRYATYTGSDPRRAPAALATIPYVEQTFGAWYIRGGLRRLADAIAGRAQQAGAKIRPGANVAQVLLDGRHVKGVRLSSGEQIPADVVVANADAAHLYGDLIPGPEGAAGRRKLRRIQPSLSGFVMMLALRGRTQGLRHHTVLFPENYDLEFDQIFGTGSQSEPVPCTEPAVYISAPDDSALRPTDQHEAWFVLVNAPPHNPIDGSQGLDWTGPGLQDTYADHVLQIMASRGFDVRDRVVFREIRTPADLERLTRSKGGSIYGSSSNGARAAFLRPANRSHIKGLFLAGGSAHPGGGLPLAGLSAAIVAELIGPA